MRKALFYATALLALGLCLGALSAQQPKPAVKSEVKAPTISDALQAKLWKAQAKMQADENSANQAQQALIQSRGQFQEAVKAITAVCGTEFQPQMSKDGDPICVAKPKK